MEKGERPRVEEDVRRLCEGGQNERAVGVTLERYGPEIGRFLVSVLHDVDLAADAFGIFGECLLKGLPDFRWESSLRTWVYKLARNTCYQLLRSANRREVPASDPVSSSVAQGERSRTQPWMQTQVKERFRALREKLEVEERMLLMLRVDQRLSWVEIAQALAEPQERLGGRELERRAASLRQEFQRLKARLRTLAVEEGLVEGEEALPPPLAR
jgi:RNA polymerase sigma-70 factor, ECF subfamily